MLIGIVEATTRLHQLDEKYLTAYAVSHSGF